MIRSALIAILALAPSAYAQDALNPVDVSDMGELWGTVSLQYITGTSTLSMAGADLDVDLTQAFGVLEAGIGLGGGFELELVQPYQIIGDLEAGGGGSELTTETIGLDDATIRANYRLMGGNIALPTVMAGIILELPIGADDVGEAEFTQGGTVIVPGEEGGPADGVLKAGAQIGVSKQFPGIEAYALLRSVFATGPQEDGDTEVELPTIFDLIVGGKIGIGGAAALDIRLQSHFIGDEVEEDLAGESTEESHIEMDLQARLYYSVGGMATLVVGVGASWIQDHAVDEEVDLMLEGTYTYQVEVGLHIAIGVPGT